MSYALLPLTLILASIAFVLTAIIGYGLTLEVIGHIRKWRRRRNWRKAAAFRAQSWDY